MVDWTALTNPNPTGTSNKQKLSELTVRTLETHQRFAATKQMLKKKKDNLKMVERLYGTFACCRPIPSSAPQ